MITELDGMSDYEAFCYLMNKTKICLNGIERKFNDMYPNDNKEVEFIHLRRFNERDKMLKTGGITICYEQVGNWMKCGIAFCSIHDRYLSAGAVDCKPIGKSLAKARLWTTPVFVHEDLFWGFDPILYTSPEGRAWFDLAIEKGMGETWALDIWRKHERCSVQDSTCCNYNNGYCFRPVE